ncbi:MAG: hypothetical protein ACOX6D_00555 [Thermoguttaceae bacterium]|jgi:hypothetical protein
MDEDKNQDGTIHQKHEEIPSIEGLAVSKTTTEHGGLYEVETPTARVYPTRGGVPGNLGDEPLSIEAIYSRRRAKDSDEEKERDEEWKSEIPEKISLPRHPFVSGLCRPLINPGMFLKFGCLTVVLWGFFLVLFPIFHKSVHSRFKAGAQPGVSVEAVIKTNSGSDEKIEVTADELTARLSRPEKFLLGNKGEIIYGAWQRFGYIFFFAFIPWFFFATPFLVQVTEQTSAGDDKINEWPNLGLMSMIGRFGSILFLALTAGIPGYFLFSPLGLARFGWVVSSLLFFPIFYLSTADTDSFFCLLSKNVLRGMRLAPKAWRNWFLISFGLVTVTSFLFICLLTDGIFRGREITRLAAVTFLSALFVTYGVFFYFRILGRLAWILRERLQADSEEKSGEVQEADANSYTEKVV